METCAEPRGGADASPSPASTPSGMPPQRYSFIHKVIDGISITVNTARIQFTSPVFVATVQVLFTSLCERIAQIWLLQAKIVGVVKRKTNIPKIMNNLTTPPTSIIISVILINLTDSLIAWFCLFYRLLIVSRDVCVVSNVCKPEHAIYLIGLKTFTFYKIAQLTNSIPSLI